MTQFVLQSFKLEIIEAEKSRIDLLKWKFLLIAILGSIGLSLKHSSIVEPYFTLCLIPLVCVYVDLLCKHLNIRILVLGTFIKMSRSLALDLKDNPALDLSQLYEEFCHELRQPRSREKNNKKTTKNTHKNMTFALEDLAQEWSTIICSIFVITIAFILPFLVKNINNYVIYFMIFSGMLGIIFTFLLSFNYQKKIKHLEFCEEEMISHYGAPRCTSLCNILSSILKRQKT
jgi:hypothetical protein